MLAIKIGQLVREGMALARGEIQFAAEAQDRISYRFRVQPPPVVAPQQLVERIDCRIGRNVGTGKLVGFRQENQPVKLLERPAAVDKIRR